MDQERIMKVVNEKNEEIEMYILFTTSLEEYGKNYIFYTDPKSLDGQVFVSSFDESNHLEPVTNEEEWNKLDEVFNQFMEEHQNEGCSGCNCSGNEDCESCENCDK